MIPPLDNPSWTPNPGPQSALFACPADLILYGGAAGGGKTDAAIVWAASGCSIPNYRGLVLRRTFPELERHIIERARQIFPESIAHYNQREHTLRFRVGESGSAVLEFGFLDTEDDVENYQGSEYTRIAADESTRLSERQIRNMLRFLRSPVGGMKCQMLLTTNPVGPGYGMHRLMFVDGRQPLKIYKDAKWLSDGRRLGLTTCFIPARLHDNPILLRKDPQYETKLRAQEGPLAQALIEGRWDVVVSTALDFVFEIHTCDARSIPPWSVRWMAVDWGVHDKAACVWMAADDQRVYAYRDFARPGREIKPYAHEIAEMGKDEGIQFCVLSHECFAQRGTGLTQADQFQDVFEKYGIPLVRSDKDAEGRLMLVREFMRTTPLDQNRKELDYRYWVDRLNRDGPQAMAEYRNILNASFDRNLPRMLIFRGPGGAKGLGCPDLIQTLPLLVVDPESPRELEDGQDDHSFDALGYGLKGFMGLQSLPKEVIYCYNLKGKIPDSELARDLAMKHAEELSESLGGTEPVRWRVERFRG